MCEGYIYPLHLKMRTLNAHLVAIFQQTVRYNQYYGKFSEFILVTGIT